MPESCCVRPRSSVRVADAGAGPVVYQLVPRLPSCARAAPELVVELELLAIGRTAPEKDGLLPMIGVGEATGVGEGVGFGACVGVGTGGCVGLGVGDGVGLGLGVAVGTGVWVGFGVEDGVGAGVPGVTSRPPQARAPLLVPVARKSFQPVAPAGIVNEMSALPAALVLPVAT